jgi:hypothetical protein
MVLNAGTLIGPASNMTIGGSWENNGGTYTHSSGTVTLTSTSTGNILEGNSASTTFYNLIINGSGGEWTVQTNDLGIANDLTMTNGTLFGSTRDVTVNGNVACGVTCGTINLTGGIFNQDVAVNKNFGTSVSADSTPWTFYGLKFSNSSGTSKTISTPTAATGNITATLGVTVGDSADTAPTVLDAGNRLWVLSGIGVPGGNVYPTVAGRTNSQTATASTAHTVTFGL